MEIKFSVAIVTLLILVGVMGYTYYNLQQFMKSESKCESGFAMINKCGCVVDIYFGELFNVREKYRVDLTNETK